MPTIETLRDKLARLMVVRIGSNLPPVRTVDQDAARIAALLETEAIGGLLLFNGDWETTPAVLADLQASSRSPLLVTSDLERGAGQQLHGLPLFPHAMAFDAAGDDAEEFVEEFARLTAVAMGGAAGVHVNYAPVADVHSEPRNPIIGTRAYSTDPQRAADLVAAFVRGTHAGGGLAAAKHFPGHGNTKDDSHHAVPVVVASREALANCELIPFRSAIAAGVDLIMSAHVCYPQLDDSGRPATLSRPILTDLLRGELGFQGAVVSDSLLMEGVASQAKTEGELAVAALRAGVDLLLDVAEPAATLDALEEAIDVGQLPLARVDKAVDRVVRLKAAVDASPIARHDDLPHDDPPHDDLPSMIEQLSSRVARRAVQTVGDNACSPSLDRGAPTCAVVIKPFETHLDSPQQPFAGAMARYFTQLKYCELAPSSTAEQLRTTRESAMECRQLVVAIIVKPAAWHAFGLPAGLEAWVQQLLAARPAVLVCLGSPEGLAPFASESALCTFSDVPASQYALADVLAGT